MSGMKLNAWGEEFELYTAVDQYVEPENLAIQLYDNCPGYLEVFAVLTVNLEAGLAKDCAFVDTENNEWAEALIKEYSLGVPTGNFARSGFCVYPEYRFNLETVKKYALEE